MIVDLIRKAKSRNKWHVNHPAALCLDAAAVAFSNQSRATVTVQIDCERWGECDAIATLEMPSGSAPCFDLWWDDVCQACLQSLYSRLRTR